MRAHRCYASADPSLLFHGHIPVQGDQTQNSTAPFPMNRIAVEREQLLMRGQYGGDTWALKVEQL